MFEVRLAQPDELDEVRAFYARMISCMRGTDFDVLWDPDVHPSEEFLRASVEAGQVYVGVLSEPGVGEVCEHEEGLAADGQAKNGCTADSRIACAMVMNDVGEPDYDKVPWRVCAAHDEAWIIHVLATLPEFHGRGFARQLLCAGIDAARAAGKKAVRLDTFTYNTRAQHLYETQGFARLGVFPDFYPDLNNIDAVVYEYAL